MPTLLRHHATTPTPTPPTLNNNLAVSYAKAEQKVVAASKRKKDSTADAKLLAKFKGEFPPSLLRVMSGEIASDGMGFHQIAMQIGITSNDLGKKEEVILSLCEGLIHNHQSDGNRYNSPGKRKAELQRMHRYTSDNVCHTYSKDAVRRLVPADVPTPDLDDPTDATGIQQGDEDSDENGLLTGVFMTDAGFFAKTENGAKHLCNIAIKDVQVLLDAVSDGDRGFEAEVLRKSKSIGRKSIGGETLLSKAHFQKFCMGHGGAMTNGTDGNVALHQLPY